MSQKIFTKKYGQISDEQLKEDLKSLPEFRPIIANEMKMTYIEREDAIKRLMEKVHDIEREIKNRRWLMLHLLTIGEQNKDTHKKMNPENSLHTDTQETPKVKSNALISKTKGFEEQNYDFVQGYIESIKSLKMSSPTLEDLEKVSKQSKASWSRRFTDPLFLGHLKKELGKMQSNTFSKKTETKKQWRLAEQAIDEKIISLPQLKDALNKKTTQFNDNIKQSPHDDLGDAYNESIQ